MFKPYATLPPHVEVQTLFDRQIIDGVTTSLQFFQPNPSGVETDNYYLNNPLTGDKYHVLLGFGIESLMPVISSEGGNNPVKVLNNLKDAVVKITTNGGRDQAILEPLKNYMNFSQNGSAVGQCYDGTGTVTHTTSIVVLQSTRPRPIPNLFYFDKNERWKFEIAFAQGNFPAAGSWTKGRFGLEATIKIASMSEGQLNEYKRRCRAVLGG